MDGRGAFFYRPMVMWLILLIAAALCLVLAGSEGVMESPACGRRARKEGATPVCPITGLPGCQCGCLKGWPCVCIAAPAKADAGRKCCCCDR
jgi:hypothetical protein